MISPIQNESRGIPKIRSYFQTAWRYGSVRFFLALRLPSHQRLRGAKVGEEVTNLLVNHSGGEPCGIRETPIAFISAISSRLIAPQRGRLAVQSSDDHNSPVTATARKQVDPGVRDSEIFFHVSGGLPRPNVDFTKDEVSVGRNAGAAAGEGLVWQRLQPETRDFVP